MSNTKSANPEFSGLTAPGLLAAGPPPTGAEILANIRQVWDQFADCEPLKVVMSHAHFDGALDVAPDVLHPGSPRTIIYGCPVEIDNTADKPRLEPM